MKKFKIILDKKRNYHNHTNYNDHADHDMSVEKVIRKAEESGLTEIAITEHVRKDSSWVANFLQDIDRVQTEINVIKGFEAKVLNIKGELDISKTLARQFLVIGSFHIFQPVEYFFEALLNLTRNPYVDIIGHLGLCNDMRILLTDKQIDALIFSIKHHNKVVEINSKYKLPFREIIEKFIKSKVMLCYGSDAHRIADIGVIKWGIDK
jgi:putative hydrolase